MLTLLRNIECYCPGYIGEKDILIAGTKIYKIAEPGVIIDNPLIETTVACQGLCAFPGLIDQHIHITGAGGEEAFSSRTKELEAGDIFEAGITTVVGLLGADGTTRTMENLYAKAKALEAAGVTVFIYSGSYAVPPVTLMGSLLRDMAYIDKVIGAGEIAVSDHRSSNPGAKELVALASEVHLGGLIAGKAGVVHLHIGDGKNGLSPLVEAVAASDLPAEMFIPTHTNRTPGLFSQAVSYCKTGGRIDLTAGEKAGLPVTDAVRLLAAEGIDMAKVTVSSDAGGSIPSGGVAKPQALYNDFVEIIMQSVLTPSAAACLFTENVAKGLRLYPAKGVLREGGDADILITDKAYRLKLLYSMGQRVAGHII